MKWYKAYIDLVGHPKRYKLESALDTIHGLHYITCWFVYVAKYSKEGDITHFDKKEIARACEWKGDADKFFDALSVSGFIDRVKGGNGGFKLIAHDWMKENRRFIEENRKQKPKGNPRETQGLPVLEEKRIDKKRKEKPNTAASAEFEAFWKLYPFRKGRKVGKPEALAQWNKLNPTGELLKTIMAGVDLIKNDEFPKDAHRWLAKKSWVIETQTQKPAVEKLPPWEQKKIDDGKAELEAAERRKVRTAEYLDKTFGRGKHAGTQDIKVAMENLKVPDGFETWPLKEQVAYWGRNNVTE